MVADMVEQVYSTGAPAGSADSAGAPARSAGALGDGAWPRPSTLAPPPVQTGCLGWKQFSKRPLRTSLRTFRELLPP